MPIFDTPIPLSQVGSTNYNKKEVTMVHHVLETFGNAVKDDSKTLCGSQTDSISYRISLGVKNSQEDGLLAGTLPNPTLAASDLDGFRTFLRETEACMANTCSAFSFSGTTLATFMLVPIQDSQPVMVGIGAGDSSVLLLYRESQSASFQIMRLTRLHKPGDPTERAWIEKIGGNVLGSGNRARLNSCPGILGSISVSRSYGDMHVSKITFKDSPTESLYHQAEISIYELPIDLDGEAEAYALVCSDGFTDVLYNDGEIPFAFEKALHYDNPADYLGWVQSQRFYDDNSTVVVMKLPQYPQHIHYVTVCDGHGGKDVSKQVIESYHQHYVGSLQASYENAKVNSGQVSIKVSPDDFSRQVEFCKLNKTFVDDKVMGRFFKKHRWDERALEKSVKQEAGENNQNELKKTSSSYGLFENARLVKKNPNKKKPKCGSQYKTLDNGELMEIMHACRNVPG